MNIDIPTSDLNFPLLVCIVVLFPLFLCEHYVVCMYKYVCYVCMYVYRDMI